MVQKFALLFGGLGATAVLAFALGLTNLVFANPTATQAPDAQTAQVVVPDVAAAGDQNQNVPQTKTVVDKVYIAPTPPPKTIHVDKPAVNSQQPNTKTPSSTPPTNTQTAKSHAGEPADHERSDDRGHDGENQHEREHGDD